MIEKLLRTMIMLRQAYRRWLRLGSAKKALIDLRQRVGLPDTPRPLLPLGEDGEVEGVLGQPS